MLFQASLAQAIGHRQLKGLVHPVSMLGLEWPASELQKLQAF